MAQSNFFGLSSFTFLKKASLISLWVLFINCSPDPGNRYTTWRVTGGSKENIRFSTLTQIDTTNVSQLKVAWTYSSHDADTVNHSQMQCNPIIVNGTLYGTSPQLKLLALDAATGKEKWVFDPQADKENPNARQRFNMNNNRGVTYWEEGEDKRILFAAGAYLFALMHIHVAMVAKSGNALARVCIDGK